MGGGGAIEGVRLHSGWGRGYRGGGDTVDGATVGGGGAIEGCGTTAGGAGAIERGGATVGGGGVTMCGCACHPT